MTDIKKEVEIKIISNKLKSRIQLLANQHKTVESPNKCIAS